LARILGVERRHELLVWQAGLVLGFDCLAKSDVCPVLRVLKFIELRNRDEDCRGLTVLCQHNPLMVVVRAGNELVKVVTCLRQRELKRHIGDSTHTCGQRAERRATADRRDATPAGTIAGCTG
jgi:hypothetical protein